LYLIALNLGKERNKTESAIFKEENDKKIIKKSPFMNAAEQINYFKYYSEKIFQLRDSIKEKTKDIEKIYLIDPIDTIGGALFVNLNILLRDRYKTPKVIVGENKNIRPEIFIITNISYRIFTSYFYREMLPNYNVIVVTIPDEMLVIDRVQRKKNIFSAILLEYNVETYILTIEQDTMFSSGSYIRDVEQRVNITGRYPYSVLINLLTKNKKYKDNIKTILQNNRYLVDVAILVELEMATPVKSQNEIKKTITESDDDDDIEQKEKEETEEEEKKEEEEGKKEEKDKKKETKETNTKLVASGELNQFSFRCFQCDKTTGNLYKAVYPNGKKYIFCSVDCQKQLKN
jgi:hypothetical protein